MLLTPGNRAGHPPQVTMQQIKHLAMPREGKGSQEGMGRHTLHTAGAEGHAVSAWGAITHPESAGHHLEVHPPHGGACTQDIRAVAENTAGCLRVPGQQVGPHSGQVGALTRPLPRG